MQIFTSNSEEETRALGARLAGTLRAGDIVALRGDLGAGKTAFVSGALAALGCEGPFPSPSFAIVREYEGKFRPVHFDMYRIKGEAELCSTGFYDYLDAERVLFIEWSENIAFALEGGETVVEIEGSGDMPRTVKIEGARL
ncbi:MAG: tRNA (adenosine(37)-N6)-threonylcarbamoyltransferase complex ATPase subunit type 1 TsaE [Oscillospiraceae bacterium]|nr:tRNA (adenosine(37)-N6)-threonylcarbamoyltransferase complex ATPase subunit type 1 TsaE [Oscillospiraceae bacterium]